MKLMFITRRRTGVSDAQIAEARPDEVRAVWALVKAGQLREIYFAPERPAVIGMVEVASRETAEEMLAALPMARRGLIEFELLTLRPYDQFELLFERPGEKSR